MATLLRDVSLASTMSCPFERAVNAILCARGHRNWIHFWSWYLKAIESVQQLSMVHASLSGRESVHKASPVHVSVNPDAISISRVSAKAPILNGCIKGLSYGGRRSLRSLASICLRHSDELRISEFLYLLVVSPCRLKQC